MAVVRAGAATTVLDLFGMAGKIIFVPEVWLIRVSRGIQTSMEPKTRKHKVHQHSEIRSAGKLTQDG